MTSDNSHPHNGAHIDSESCHSGNTGSSASDPLANNSNPPAQASTLNPGQYHNDIRITNVSSTQAAATGDASQLAGSLKRRCSLTSPILGGADAGGGAEGLDFTAAHGSGGAGGLLTAAAANRQWQPESSSCGTMAAPCSQAVAGLPAPADLRPQFGSGSGSGPSTSSGVRATRRSFSQPDFPHLEGLLQEVLGSNNYHHMMALGAAGNSHGAWAANAVAMPQGGTGTLPVGPAGSSLQEIQVAQVAAAADDPLSPNPQSRRQFEAEAAHRHSGPQAAGFKFPPRLGIILPTDTDLLGCPLDSPSKRRRAAEPGGGSAIGPGNIPGSSFESGSGNGSNSGDYPMVSSSTQPQAAAKKFPWGRTSASGSGGCVTRSAEMPLQTAGYRDGRYSTSPCPRSPLGGSRGQAGPSTLGMSEGNAAGSGGSDMASLAAGRVGAPAGTSASAWADGGHQLEPAEGFTRQQRMVSVAMQNSHSSYNQKQAMNPSQGQSQIQSGGQNLQQQQQQQQQRVMNASLSYILARKHALPASNLQLVTASVKVEGEQSAAQGHISSQGVDSTTSMGVDSSATGAGAPAAGNDQPGPSSMAGAFQGRATGGGFPSAAAAAPSDLPALLAGDFGGSAASIERQMDALDAILRSFPASVAGGVDSCMGGEGGWNGGGNGSSLAGTGRMPSMDAFLMGDSDMQGMVPTAQVTPPAARGGGGGGGGDAGGGGYSAACGNRNFTWTEQLKSMAELHSGHQEASPLSAAPSNHLSGSASALSFPSLPTSTSNNLSPTSLEAAVNLLTHGMDAGSLDSPGSGSNRARRALAAMAAGINLGSAQLDALLPLTAGANAAAGGAAGAALKQSEALLRDALSPAGALPGGSEPLLPLAGNAHADATFTSSSLPARCVRAAAGAAGRPFSDARLSGNSLLGVEGHLSDSCSIQLQSSSLGDAPFPGRSGIHARPTSSGSLHEKKPAAGGAAAGGDGGAGDSAGPFPLSGVCKSDGAVLQGFAERSARKIFERRQAALRAAEEREGKPARGRTREQKKALEQDRRAQEREGFSRLRAAVPVPFVTQYAHETGRQPAPGKKEVDLGTLLRAAASYIALLQVSSAVAVHC